MIFVHLIKSWPDVKSGSRTAADVTLGDWALVADAGAEKYGDVICGVVDGEVVSAYDITGYTRLSGGRVRFSGTPSIEWAFLLGTHSPVTWTRGQARPVRYFDTNGLRNGTAAIEETPDGMQRAVVGEFTLTVAPDGTATVVGPIGRAVTVTSRAA